MTPDADQSKPDRPDAGDLQIKTASAWKAADWKADEEWPLHYQIQCQAELFVTGMQWGSIAVLIGGQRLRWFDFERNEDFIAAMLPKLEEFWHAVETKTPPAVDDSVATAHVLAKLFPQDNGETVELTGDEVVAWANEMEEAKAIIKEQESRLQWCKNRLIHAIGEASFVILPDGRKFSYKQQTRKEHTVPESTFRVLRACK